MSLRSIARRSAERPRLTFGVWALVLIAAFSSIGILMKNATTTEVTFLNNPPSARAAAAVEKSFAGQTGIVETVVLTATTDAAVERLPSAATAVGQAITALGPDAVTTVDPPGGVLSRDGRSAILRVAMVGNEEQARTAVSPMRSAAADAAGSDITVHTAGQASVSEDLEGVSKTDLQKAELIGIPIALIILLVVFRSAVAAAVPLVLSIVSIIVAMGLTAVAGSAYQLSFFITNMITMMGLAVGIDYALFVISRYRDEREQGREVIDAIETASMTAGRAVFYSGLTVVVAMAGMLIVPTTIFLSLGLGAIFVVLVALAASVTLLPAVLAVLGDRLERLALPRLRAARDGGIWTRVAKAVMRRPVIALVGSVAVLLVAALPMLDMKTGTAGIETLPSGLNSRQAYDLMSRDFGIRGIASAEVVVSGAVDSPAAGAAVASLTTALASNAIFGAPTTDLATDGSALRLTIPVNEPATSAQAIAAVTELRDRLVPEAFGGTSLDAVVGGVSSQNIDYFSVTDRFLPIVVGIVLVLSFVVLLVAFRSVVIPLVAIGLNLLSVGAAFGLLTLVTQKGYGAGLLGFENVPQVEAWIPLFLFAVLFGLSMDYHVFLLSRIRERYDGTGDTADAVEHGISTSARLITGAALIMVAVFAGFASGQLVMFQQMGFGLAVAILIDATLIRSVIVPAAMRILGPYNWYLPARLGWLPEVDMEGASTG